ncbi:MAG: hypothetical protein FWF29_00410 [Treponema sp.]|nr:hypothetical protein [Treponema sp.]
MCILFSFLSSCKALQDDPLTGDDSLFFVPPGYVVRFETGKGSPIRYQDGLELGDKALRPADPVYTPDPSFNFINWFQHSPYAKNLWDFDTELSENCFPNGKVLTLYARFDNPVKQKYVIDNGIWGNNNLDDLIGQIIPLEQGVQYTVKATYWFMNTDQNREAPSAPVDRQAHGQLQAFFFVNLDWGGFRDYDLNERMDSEDLWTNAEYTFTARKSDWYGVGITTGNTLSGNTCRFFIRSMSLKDGDGNELFSWGDFTFGVNTGEEYSCVTGGNGGRFLTASGPDPSLYEGIWYTGLTDWTAVTENAFLQRSEVIDKIDEQGGVFLNDE